MLGGQWHARNRLRTSLMMSIRHAAYTAQGTAVLGCGKKGKLVVGEACCCCCCCCCVMDMMHYGHIVQDMYCLLRPEYRSHRMCGLWSGNANKLALSRHILLSVLCLCVSWVINVCTTLRKSASPFYVECETDQKNTYLQVPHPDLHFLCNMTA